MRVVGNQVAAANLERIHGDRPRRHLHETLGHRGRDRVADRAVLAHDILVLEHHTGAGAVVAAGVGTAHEIDDLVCLDAACARVDRVGADAGERIDLEGGDGPVAPDADPALDAMVAGVNVGDEALEPIGHELDRTFQQFRQRDGCHLVGIGVDLDAERAAHVLGDDAHLMLLQAKVLGEQVLHHVRRLRRVIGGQPLLARVPVGNDGARLVADAGVAAEHESVLDDGVGLGETLVRIAGRVHALEGEIVAEFGMDHRRARVERRLRVGHRWKFLVFDLHEFAAVLGLGARARNDGADRFACPAGAIDGDGVLRRRLDALQVREHADPGGDDLRQFGAGHHRNHARRLFRRGRIDSLDARVRMRRADKRHVRHARQRHVGDELGAALQQPAHVGPRY